MIKWLHRIERWVILLMWVLLREGIRKILNLIDNFTRWFPSYNVVALCRLKQAVLGVPCLGKKPGDLVGIVTHRYGMYCMAVHVSAIKAFVAEAAAISIHENIGANGLEASTSREI